MYKRGLFKFGHRVKAGFLCWFVLGFQLQLLKAQDFTKYVNPLIGTAISTTESAIRHSQDGSELRGQTFPAVGVPHGMTSWTAQTRASERKCVAPYYYEDKKIQGFRGSHWLSGSCTQDYGSFTMMPIAGKLETDAEKRASSYTHSSEQARPYSYRVTLEDDNIQTAMTGLSHSAMFSFRFAKEEDAWICIEPNSDQGEGFIQIDASKNEISGYNPVHRIYQGQGKSAGFSGYFVLAFDRSFESYGTWNGADLKHQSVNEKGSGRPVGAFVKLPLNKEKLLRVKVGCSFSSMEQARKNLAAEIEGWDFQALEQKVAAQWNAELAKIKVEGAEKDKVNFYTALYHTKLLPREVSDVDGSYNAFAAGGKLLQAKGFKYYDDYSLWDTYRALHPLQLLMEPSRSEDMVTSLLKKAEQGGWLPVFPCWNSYTSAMIGDHAIAMIADAMVKGIVRKDREKLYQVMRKNAFQVNDDSLSYKDGRGRRALSSYLKYGFIPLEDGVADAFHTNEQVSRTLEYAYDDYVLARVAKLLGKTRDYHLLIRRSQNYRHVFDTATGYVRGRYLDGKWITPFEPFAIRSGFITEGSAFQYSWYVPHDVPGLIELMGGSRRFVKQLDLLFDQRHYWHGNEPGHHSAYLYAFAGMPWKTQLRVRNIIREEYHTGPGGLSGNEDAGQMSAWLAFGMMGFYPVCPGTPDYMIGTPSFRKVTLSLGRGKTFTITAPGLSASDFYIQKAMLNGRTMNRSQLSHQEIQGGGRLVLFMGKVPNPEWGNQVLPKK
ncbi:alpha-1,2-mannosidase, putative [Pedobacter steynii]|uniref:Alpha-1,2-mannosidase, putative n=1 Tax=Pedobacter steynii TaxID=430522 RepID=A0A1G9NZF2_9SPHI|nr:GH92 family glycosyl hydrolase [Pedobacter steynii]NQX39138.1 glycoside hydrolase family 92 protein [Pedobacter steynii]SDL92002.1 alpha-1,2-mannosidase, putative [Pedobacter steynii]